MSGSDSDSLSGFVITSRPMDLLHVKSVMSIKLDNDSKTNLGNLHYHVLVFLPLFIFSISFFYQIRSDETRINQEWIMATITEFDGIDTLFVF